MSRVPVLSFTLLSVVLAGCTPKAEPKIGPEPVGPQIAVKAGDLLKEYGANALAADGKYKGKRIIVSGKVDSVRKAPLYGYILQLVSEDATDDTLTGIQCILGHEPAPEAAALKEGDKVRVIGTCDGQVVGQLKLAKCVVMK